MVSASAEESLKRKLEAMGYSVESRSVLKGKSGVSHGFALHGKKGRRDEFVVEIESSGRPAALSLIALRAKAFDTGVPRLFLVTDSPMDEEAERLAELYRVRVIPEDAAPEELNRQLRGPL